MWAQLNKTDALFFIFGAEAERFQERGALMSSSYRPNRHFAPSIRGQRAVDAEEQRMRALIRRENAQSATRKAALLERSKASQVGAGQRPLLTNKLKKQP